ncbi:MAG: helix-turn-helix domain-containing protein [Alphaproteobacteria bacterium]
MTTKQIDPIDAHVGQRVRLRRMLMGMSQEKLAQELGLTFQQIQKYEKGANRISASKLYRIGKVLEAPPGYFFEEMEGTEAPGEPAPLPVNRDTIELTRCYMRLSPEVRRATLQLVRSMAGSDTLAAA